MSHDPTRPLMPVWPNRRETKTEGYFLSQPVSIPTHLPQNRPNYTLWEHRHTRTNFALSSPPLSSLPTLDVPDTDGSISQRRRRLWSIFSLILSFHIKGRFVSKLTKSSVGPRQRANIPKCLSTSICLMVGLSISMVCVFLHWPFSFVRSIPTIITDSCIFVLDYYFHHYPSPLFSLHGMSNFKDRGSPLFLPLSVFTLFQVKFLHLSTSQTVLTYITMETTTFFLLQDLLNHVVSVDLLRSQRKGEYDTSVLLLATCAFASNLGFKDCKIKSNWGERKWF